jgi:putative transposase
MKYAIIKELRLQYPVKALCNQMELSESGYCNWRSRPLSRRRQDDTHLKVVIKAAHKRTRETSGPERLQQYIVKNEGMRVGVHRIKRLRKELGIRCRQKQKFKATTNFNHSLPVAPNLVDQKFAATAPDQIWLTDITYIWTGEGWLYLAPIENFWDTLKNELVYHHSYETREQAIRDITEYIEIFYNRQRIQKRLDYLSPAAYEKKYYEKLLAT